MKTPISLELMLTSICNLRCTFCCHFSSASDVRHELPKTEWLNFFEELGECCVMNVTISGGEPFLRKDLPGLIMGIVHNRMRFSIISNGTLISEENAAFLASTGRCDKVQVSIDGSNPGPHDSCRGDGNFLKAIEGIKRLRKYKVPVTVRVTINRHNINDLEEIARLLLEDLRLPDFSTNEASYAGLCRKNKEEIRLNVKEYSFVMKKLVELNQGYNGRINATAGPLANARHWSKMEYQARRKVKNAVQGKGFLMGCGGVFSRMAVRADGVMVPCSQMSHIELGRINVDNLKELWQNHLELKRLRERRNIPLREFEFCKGCDYIPYCTGNCPTISYNIIGKEDHPSPDACFRRFLEAGGRLPMNFKYEEE
jgi:SynChlorMet cassette radical SAM/SPASM protein ScmE